MKKFLLLLIVIPSLLFPQSAKKYPTLLWKISGNGLKKPSFVYGTMHVSNRVAYHLSEQFFDALKSVDVVGLETNPGDWLSNMEKTGELSQETQFSSANNYGKDFYTTAFDVYFPDKRVLQSVIRYDPDIINGLLYRHNSSKENFEENTYIDLFIFQTASKLNKQVISLEDFVQSEIKAKLSALPDDVTNDEDEFKRYKNIYTSAQKIEDAYREGNLDLLDSLSKATSSRNTQKYLIDDRNIFFVNTIDSVLKSKTIFSGVGAAHLPGNSGVIELLRQKGYTVEPIFPKNTKKSDQKRDELDAQIKPVSFVKQYIHDSTIQISVPGKLYKIVDLENIKYSVCADMVNGSFYTIARLKYNGPLFNFSSSKMMARMDSLLFENIPGKIISKKEISSNNGLKGLEIINKTRRGDEQRYQIFFSELEVIIFKVGGKMQYASGNEARQFFNSLQFQNISEKMTDFTPKTKGFSVKIPANYSYIKNNGSSMKGIVEDLHAYQNESKQFYGVKHAVYSDFQYLEEDTFELNLLSKNVLKNFKFNSNIKRELFSFNGLPAVKFSAKNKMSGNFYGMIIIKGIHYYLVYQVSDKELSFENEFFNSFKLSDFVCVNPVKEITDKEFAFKANDEVTDNSSSRFNELYLKAYNEAKGNKTKEKEKTNPDFDYRSSSKLYYSPSSNEYINIFYEKYNDYDYRTLKDIEEALVKNVKTYNSMYPTKIRTNNDKGIFTLQTTLKDTATSRAIEFKIILKNGIRYEISAPYDTTIGLRSWSKDFFESFHLKDTLIGKNVLENKISKLYTDLYSNDTLIRKQANISIQNSVGMQKAFIDDYIVLLNNPNFHLINEDSKAQLFVNGGTVESEKIIEPYKKLYKQYTDSFYLQLSLLKGLAYLKTGNSYNTFYNLISNETPLVGANNVVNDIFNVLHDSLQLCKNFFPGLLTLTKYEEYKSSVYSLLANLVKSGIVNPSVYAAQKENILSDANLSLKRYSPGTKTQPNEYADYNYIDKIAKELAENIQSNLEGINNNNLFKETNYLRNIEAFNRPELVNYAIILAPYYKTDEKTKQFFAKLTKIKAQNIAMPAFITLLKNNIQLNDTLLEFYCKNKNTRVFFYSELEKEKLTDKFDKKYLTQESLNESLVLTQKQLAGIYSYEKEKKQKDSLVLVKSVEAKNKYQKGKLYFYKMPKSKFEDETWAIVFVNGSKHPISSNIEVLSISYQFNKDKSIDENINEILNDFYISYRKRAISATNSLYYPEAYEQ